MEKLAIASVFCIFAIAMVSYTLASTGFISLGGVSESAKELASCMSEKDVVIYYSAYCGACNQQKSLFGESFDTIEGVDCAVDPDTCHEAGIRSVPTWIIEGKQHVGVKSVTQLAELTGC